MTLQQSYMQRVEGGEEGGQGLLIYLNLSGKNGNLLVWRQSQTNQTLLHISEMTQQASLASSSGRGIHEKT